MTALERRDLLLDHDVVRKRVVPHATGVGSSIERTLKVPHQLDAALIVLAVVLGRANEDATVDIPPLKIRCIDVEIEHAQVVEYEHVERGARARDDVDDPRRDAVRILLVVSGEKVILVLRARTMFLRRLGNDPLRDRLGGRERAPHVRDVVREREGHSLGELFSGGTLGKR